MPERKRRRSLSHSEMTLGFDETSFFLEDAHPIEVGAGYSLSIDYDDDGIPLIRVKTYGDVDLAELRSAIRKRYPEAKIREVETPVIEIVKPSRKRRKIRPVRRKKRKK